MKQAIWCCFSSDEKASGRFAIVQDRNIFVLPILLILLIFTSCSKFTQAATWEGRNVSNTANRSAKLPARPSNRVAKSGLSELVPSLNGTATDYPRLRQPQEINTERPIARSFRSNSGYNLGDNSSFQTGNKSIIGEMLLEGDRIERPGIDNKIDWNDALNYWEKTLRQYPSDSRLKSRYNQARIYYDIGHRLADSAYLSAVNSMTLSESRKNMTEILQKIQNQYVSSPNWDSLAQCGRQGVKLALADKTFQACFLYNTNASTIEFKSNQWLNNAGNILTGSPEDLVRQASILAAMGQRDFKINESVIMMEYLCGILNSLDQYTSLLTPTQLNDMLSQIEGHFVGIGVELKAVKGQLRIVRTMADSPARQSGLLPGDTIVSVDGKKTSEYSPEICTNRLLGDSGSTVCVVVSRKIMAADAESIINPTPSENTSLTNANQTNTSQTKTFYIVRRPIESCSIEKTQIIDLKSKTGYLKINNFQKSTADELDKALLDLYEQGMRRLIIDLRGNSGGLLTSAVEVSNRFLSSGVVVFTRGKNPVDRQQYSANSQNTWQVPLVLLIDGNSASAAEIFAGAMRDYHRAAIVGTRSYGKGSVQGIFPLQNSTMGLRLTTSQFYSPAGLGYALTGVTPEIEVHTTARMTNSEDAGEDFIAVSQENDRCLQAGIEAAAQIQF